MVNRGRAIAWTLSLLIVGGSIVYFITIIPPLNDTTIRPTVAVPPWAKVAPEQIAEAKKHGVPVAFENDLGMRFVLIPAGTFQMGSPKTEVGHDRYETLHSRKIDHGYYLQATEVTNASYLQFRPSHAGRYLLASERRSQSPVTRVSWNEAVEFADWLSRDGPYEYRLPTEAEWEYACRAGSRSRFFFGDDAGELPKFANTSEGLDLRTARPEDCLDGHLRVAPVASYRPNKWGLYDMHGNVSEMCSDCFRFYDHTKEDCRVRMIRGGRWQSGPEGVACANRISSDPSSAYEFRGFRLVVISSATTGRGP